jgi:hypothetical protein
MIWCPKNGAVSIFKESELSNLLTKQPRSNDNKGSKQFVTWGDRMRQCVCLFMWVCVSACVRAWVCVCVCVCQVAGEWMTGHCDTRVKQWEWQWVSGWLWEGKWDSDCVTTWDIYCLTERILQCYYYVISNYKYTVIKYFSLHKITTQQDGLLIIFLSPPSFCKYGFCSHPCLCVITLSSSRSCHSRHTIASPCLPQHKPSAPHPQRNL